MKKTLLNLTIAALCGLPRAGLAQGTYLSAPDGNPSNAIVVVSGGNVGIGTASPTVRFHVFGDQAYIEGTSAAAALQVKQRGTGPAALFRNGNVGIGTPYPAFKLHVVGTSDVELARFQNETGTARISLDATGNNGRRWNIESTSGRFSIADSTANADRLSINASGHVGIGTISPNNRLTIQGPTGSGDLVSWRNEANTLGGLGVNSDINAGWFGLRNGAGSGSWTISIDAAGSSYFNAGNVGIGTSTPQAPLDVAGKARCQVLELTSDRHQKTGFAPVDNQTILDQVARLPISTWRYTNEPAVQHIGPVAQDFKAAFGVGSDDKHIATVDADGVLFAALQGLNQKLEAELRAKENRIAALESKLAEQERIFAARFAALEKIVAQTNSGKASDDPAGLAPTAAHPNEVSLTTAASR